MIKAALLNHRDPFFVSKPFSQACENNKHPILCVIRPYFQHSKTVLEIGSGTGQHAVYFAENLPQLVWQTSDVKKNHEGINAWRNDSGLKNLPAPLLLDVDHEWPQEIYDGVFSANTTHIMSWSSVENLFSGVASVLLKNGYFCLYGPFNFDGEYTSESNRQFDFMLRSRDSLSGVRDFEALNCLAEKNSLEFVFDHEMPANNRILVWKKR